MNEREQLRDKLATVVGAYDKADAVLAVPDQQGWVSREEHQGQMALMKSVHEEHVGNLTRALREAARYEPIDGWRWNGVWFHRHGDDCGKFCMPIASLRVTEGAASSLAEAFIRGFEAGAERPQDAGDGDAMGDAYRAWQVTEGEEG